MSKGYVTRFVMGRGWTYEVSLGFRLRLMPLHLTLTMLRYYVFIGWTRFDSFERASENPLETSFSGMKWSHPTKANLKIVSNTMKKTAPRKATNGK